MSMRKKNEDGVPHPMDVALGARVRILRKEQKLSQDMLAREIGITFQQVQKYEHGTNRISFSRMCEIAKALDITVTDLIEPLVAKGRASKAPNVDHLALLGQPYVYEMLRDLSQLTPTRRRSVVKMVGAFVSETG